ncbi:hypothetical protein F5146DRAFT_1005494 [Armillaria mellea]|nr:hypothetical protein F5146DRAFT_1005494 [Armillaria mellea]
MEHNAKDEKRREVDVKDIPKKISSSVAIPGFVNSFIVLFFGLMLAADILLKKAVMHVTYTSTMNPCPQGHFITSMEGVHHHKFACLVDTILGHLTVTTQATLSSKLG